MAAKRPNLAALADAAGSIRVLRDAPRQDDRQESASVVAGRQAPRSARDIPPSRVGKQPVTAFFPEEVRTQLKFMSIEQRRSMESLIGEALNDLFAKYGKPEIAPRTKA